MTAKYSQRFYEEDIITAGRSAAEIVPLIIKLLPIKSVVDVGCGAGAWLAEFKKHGVTETVGIDGTHAHTEWLDQTEFIVHDLTKRIALDRTFDLSMCLEVAEHLPLESADTLVTSLCSLSKQVIFSAAVPHQGGLHHINEQWPEYWEQKFRKNGYTVIDCFRETLWDNNEVAYWYAQNLLLFVHESALTQSSELSALAKATNRRCLSRIHPKTFLKSRERLLNPAYIISRLIWNSCPKSIRSLLIKRYEKQIWQQVNTGYGKPEEASN
jgi:SAM-dependent methyltransferase